MADNRDTIKKNDGLPRRKRAMCKACELAKYTINECLDRNLKIDTPKVQKLLVLMQGIHLYRYGKYMFREKVEIWECGVAIREVHKAFKQYIFGINERQNCYIMLLDDEEEVLNEVLDTFGTMDVFEISQDPRLKKLVERFYVENQAVEVPNEEIRKAFKE